MVKNVLAASIAALTLAGSVAHAANEHRYAIAIVEAKSEGRAPANRSLEPGTVGGKLTALQAEGFKTTNNIVIDDRGSSEPQKMATGEEIPYVEGFVTGRDGRKVEKRGTVKVGTSVAIARGTGDEVTVSAEDAQLVQMITLNGGAQLGNLTKPHTTATTVSDKVELSPGKVLVLPVGGSGPIDRRLVLSRD